MPTSPHKKNEQANTKNPAFFFWGGERCNFFLANRDLKHEILAALNL